MQGIVYQTWVYYSTFQVNECPKPMHKSATQDFLLTVSLKPEKKQKLLLLCEETLKLDQMTIRHLAKVIGKLVSTFPTGGAVWPSSQ